jgi:hypothetical protein
MESIKSQSFVMANEQVAVVVAQVHAVAFAVTEHAATGAFSFAGPFAVAEVTESASKRAFSDKSSNFIKRFMESLLGNPSYRYSKFPFSFV